jgi:hypothetical protein
VSDLGQHDGDGIRYAMHLSAPKGGSAQMLRDPSGGWVSWEDYARLKAEVERLTQLNDTLALRYDATNSMLDGCAKTIEEMEAQVERLTKAGDELHAFLINYIVESRISSAYLNKLDDDWNAAKEGKQS